MKVTFSHNSTKAGQLMKKLKNFSIKAGWFENAKYGDNKSVAGIAAVQDGGATISHPGGTPYKFGADGKVVFVEKGTPNQAGVTQPHTIVIPPRPFMKPSVEDNKEDFVGQIEQISRKFLNGDISEQQAAEMIGAEAAGNIKRRLPRSTRLRSRPRPFVAKEAVMPIPRQPAPLPSRWLAAVICLKP